jgi:DNA invertase Pin-like site-specific DNA recombinase
MTKPLIRAAQYVRMSTERQNYSIEYQTMANTAYAVQRGYELARTYTDAGISGLSLKGRRGLKTLLADVVGGTADFEVILVYDVSRWGRFQDTDQSAHYEFICREAGVPVEYSAETFPNDGSLASTLIKSLKRAMAAEYSRELSEKVSGAQRGLAAKGYWQGGPPGLGLRRVARHPDGRTTILEHGQWNAVRGVRIGLVAGPSDEVALVRWIFDTFLQGYTTTEIARELNQADVPSATGAPWGYTVVRKILQSEKYVGTLAAGRTRSRLGFRVHVPSEHWIRVPGVLEPIISRATFDAVQVRYVARKRALPADDETMLDTLRAALEEHGRLSFRIVREHPRTHYPSSYVRRFGSLEAAFALVGYTFSRQQQLAAERIRQHRPDHYRSISRRSEA